MQLRWSSHCETNFVKVSLVWINFGNLVIKDKMEGGCEAYLVPFIWDAEYWCIANSVYCMAFKGRKKDKFIPDRKNTTIIVFDKPIWKTFCQYKDWEYGFLPSIVFDDEILIWIVCCKMSSLESFGKTFTLLVPLSL